MTGSSPEAGEPVSSLESKREQVWHHLQPRQEETDRQMPGAPEAPPLSSEGPGPHPPHPLPALTMAAAPHLAQTLLLCGGSSLQLHTPAWSHLYRYRWGHIAYFLTEEPSRDPQRFQKDYQPPWLEIYTLPSPVPPTSQPRFATTLLPTPPCATSAVSAGRLQVPRCAQGVRCPSVHWM